VGTAKNERISAAYRTDSSFVCVLVGYPAEQNDSLRWFWIQFSYVDARFVYDSISTVIRVYGFCGYVSR
jgi:hypothetical protein